jgi:hypothetical protein
MAAYHTICTNCAGSDRAIDDMEKRRKSSGSAVAQPPSSDRDAESSTAEINEEEEVVVEEEKPTSTLNDDDATSTIPPADQTAIKRARRRLRVCAMCTAEPALSKHSYGDGEDEDLIEEIHLIEDKIEDGVNDDGKKLTLREIKTLERKIEKLQLEMKERRRARYAKEEEEEEEGDDDDEDSNGGDEEEAESVQLAGAAEEQDDDEDDANDPFLLAVGGKDKLLVGEEYQKMLLARGQQQS